MQIQQAVLQQVNITSSSPVDRAVKTESRRLLQKMASDLIKKDGTVKSGYLKLNVSNNGSSIKSNHIGGGATDATTLVKNLVMNAYGKEASDALERYLDGKGKNKVGTLSFVKLVQSMEEDFQNTTNRFAAVPELAEVKGLDSGSLDVSHLQSWPTIVNNAHSKVISKLREAATYLDAPAPTTFTQLQDSLVKAQKHFNDLSEAIKINEADGREIDANMPDGAQLLVRLQQVIDQASGLLNDPKTALLKIAEGLKEDTVMTQLKLQRTEAKEQIFRLADAHEKLDQQALGPNMTAKQINEVIEQQEALLVQVQALVAQDKSLANQMFDVATRSLARAIGPVVQLDEADQPQWSQEVGPAVRSDLSAAFNNAREHMVRGNPSPVDEASRRGLSHYEYQMQSVQTRLKQQAAKLETGSSGKDLGNQILNEMRGLNLALHGALSVRGKVEDLLWGKLNSETSKSILQDALLFGRFPSPLQEQQLQELSHLNDKIDLCRQQALDRIKAFKAGIEANEGDVLSGTAKSDLLRALDQWDRRIRIADTDAGLDNLSHSILQQYEEPAVPESLRNLGPAWKFSKHGNSIAVYNPKTDVHLFTGSGERTTFPLVDSKIQIGID
jgi:hypothetical protein